MFLKPITLTLTASLLFTNIAMANELSFTISGLKTDEGNSKLYVQLFKGENNYQKGVPYSSNIVNVNSKDIVLSFNNLEAGDYAVRYFHDLNNNGKMDVNLFGAPIEGYGFSNDAKPNYGPVKFVKTKFSIDNNKDKTNHSSVIYGE